ncbi:MAG TPA: TolC family protein [bacterium]|nr:TolC family protein [bacterium]
MKIAWSGLSLCLVAAALSSHALAAPLPQPLTLQAALVLAADENHYDLQLRAADMDAARAGLRTAQGENDLLVGFEARARYIEAAELSADQSHNDSAAVLVARKRLFDSGRRGALEHAAQASIESEEQRMSLAQQQRKLDVMRAFYDVLLADRAFALMNERMAIVYVDFDKVKDRRELGQLSQVDLLRVQTGYEEALRERNLAEARQRTARVKLAAALGDVTQLPAVLSEPALVHLESSKAPEIDKLLQDALERNPQLLALRHQLQAANNRIEAARAKRIPVVDAVVEGGAYNRQVGSNDPFRAGLVFSAPLVVGGTYDGELARAEAERRRAHAMLVRMEAELRQRLTELVLDIDVLRKTVTGDKVRADYRDLYMERSRALYEMEVSTDLGDSMVQLTDAQMRATRTLYTLSMAWAELDVLVGRPVDPFAASTPTTQGKTP